MQGCSGVQQTVAQPIGEAPRTLHPASWQRDVAPSKKSVRHFLLVPNASNGRLSFISVSTLKIGHKVPAGAEAQGVAYTPDRTKIYVAGASTLSVISATTRKVTKIISGLQCTNQGIAVSPDGSQLYVLSRGGSPSTCIDSVPGTVLVIDTATDSITDSIAVGVRPTDVVFSTDGKTAYVLNNSNSVSVIDTQTDTVTQSITTKCGGNEIAIDPSGVFVYVTGSFSCGIDIIDTSSNTRVGQIVQNGQGEGMAFFRKRKRALVANFVTNSVDVIDLLRRTVKESIPVAKGPFAVAVSPDQTTAYVLSYTAGMGTLIDLSTLTVTSTFETGPFPDPTGSFYF
jgi:YVTN family beta-propeller protein